MSKTPSTPVTVSIRREVDPTRITEATAWVQAGASLASAHSGFLGSGWVRESEDSHHWHMLYRFADEAALDAWEASGERAWWLRTGEGFVRSEHIRRRTGIEGWFDEPSIETISVPSSTGSTTVRVAPSPPRWKQAVSIWLGFFPLNLAFTCLMTPVPGWNALPIWLRVLATTLALTPIMTYLVLPWVTRFLRRWLSR